MARAVRILVRAEINNPFTANCISPGNVLKYKWVLQPTGFGIKRERECVGKEGRKMDSP